MVTSTTFVHPSSTSAVDMKEVSPSSSYLAADTSSMETVSSIEATSFPDIPPTPQQTPEPSDMFAAPTESVLVEPSDDNRIPSSTGSDDRASVIAAVVMATISSIEATSFTDIPPTAQQTPEPSDMFATPADQASVIAAVVMAVLLVIIVALLISFIAAVVLKKRSKKFSVTHTNLQLGVSNRVYGN